MSYRAAGSIATMAIAWGMTGEIAIAAAIGLSDTLVKLALFYVHERAWDRIGFGRAQSGAGRAPEKARDGART